MTATDHLATFVPGAHAIFVRTQLLVHIPPQTEFDPFVEAEELDGSQVLTQIRLCFILTAAATACEERSLLLTSQSTGKVPLSPLFWTAHVKLHRA
ncbi:hypothetical protein JCGZ_24183 [Jatropha curcas]|uniref:Uncharacterized protein n=1 Tax=Jatropha curcas TaxID=180498 RepID=A0A067JYU7_JATCU|nr:hypothetical protein JCGZ_24183 [Jatropha curcas]